MTKHRVIKANKYDSSKEIGIVAVKRNVLHFPFGQVQISKSL